MRTLNRGHSRTRRRNDGSFWLSFSDLMSSLVLIIILVMFYFIYQYFNQAEQNAIEIAAQREALETAQQQLDDKQVELDLAMGQVAEQAEALSTQADEIETQQTLLATQQEQLDAQAATLEEQQTALATQQAQIEELVGMRTQIITQLSTELKDNSISATVDPATGSITLESDVMFDFSSYKLSERGKKFIDNFLPVYLNVLFSPDNLEFVSEVIIEGHADRNGSYIDNMELSQQRAFAVAEYIFSSGCSSVTGDQKRKLQSLLTVNGRSYSDPVYRSTGGIDDDASRRVIFKFRLTDEKMINQLQSILEADN